MQQQDKSSCLLYSKQTITLYKSAAKLLKIQILCKHIEYRIIYLQTKNMRKRLHRNKKCCYNDANSVIIQA